jgi:hypothetical protein
MNANAGGSVVNADENACPDGLNERQCERLREYVRRGQMVSPEGLLRTAHAHVDNARAAYHVEPAVNVNLAVCILQVLDLVVTQWASFTPAQQSWLRGAMGYFARSDDEQPDFAQHGFGDDVEVLNACLRHVNRGDLVLEVWSE